MDDLVVSLFEVEAVKFGSFRLKSGVDSPIYFDLRVIVSYPSLLAQVGEVMWNAIEKQKIIVNCLCGVPYAALPFATCISTSHDVPMVMRRKEVKAHGTKRAVEGKVNENEKCLIVEDVVSTGGSILETAEVLRAEGMVVENAIVLLNRDQGGTANLHGQGIQLISVLSIHEVLDILVKHEKIKPSIAQEVTDYISGSTPPIRKIQRPYSYKQRANVVSNPTASRLLTLMDEKRTNLAFSADVPTSKELIRIVDEVGPHICLLKTHVDILPDFTLDVAKQLKSLAKKHAFVIMEDRKFSDIGNTCKLQYNYSHYHMQEEWADLVTAHALPGPGVIKALREVVPEGSGCVLVAEMSSEGNLAISDYVQSAVKMAEENKDFVVGVVCQKKLSDKPEIIHMTPGVNIVDTSDALGQQYNSPEQVVGKRFSDLVIVGRGIYQATDPSQNAELYKEKAFQEYMKSLQDQ